MDATAAAGVKEAVFVIAAPSVIGAYSFGVARYRIVAVAVGAICPIGNATLSASTVGVISRTYTPSIYSLAGPV